MSSNDVDEVPLPPERKSIAKRASGDAVLGAQDAKPPSPSTVETAKSRTLTSAMLKGHTPKVTLIRHSTATPASRQQSVAFRSECPPMFLQAVTSGRKAVISEKNFNYKEAVELYSEALEALSHVKPVPSLDSVVQEKSADYTERIKSLRSKLDLKQSADMDASPPIKPTHSNSSPPVATSATTTTTTTASPQTSSSSTKGSFICAREYKPRPASDIEDIDQSEPVQESPFPKKHKEFVAIFGDEISPSEVLVSYYSCKLDINNDSVSGKMWVTNNLICFSSGRQPIKRIYRFVDIKAIYTKMYRIELYTHSDELIMFKGIISVSNCYSLLSKILRSCKIVFGIPLRDLLKKENRLGFGVPLAVERLVNSLSTEEARSEEGIFRVPSHRSDLEALIEAINSGTAVYENELIVTKADALRKFFRELPEPLFTFDLYEPFLSLFGVDVLHRYLNFRKLTYSIL
eukprot:TRINITY_DN3223_c0_g1_i2.p1 TRINITY_DN3223_c0_g1~~TRINITY_DN3223_c0_g1_i2.p1  ORF type:complete len:461 (+),score=76.58 TRINITY_DN3223_c0_g1_i2:43-1425(+)